MSVYSYIYIWLYMSDLLDLLLQLVALVPVLRPVEPLQLGKAVQQGLLVLLERLHCAL